MRPGDRVRDTHVARQGRLGTVVQARRGFTERTQVKWDNGSTSWTNGWLLEPV